MTDTVVVEGQAKFRDGKKWKSRWVVLRRPSPVADCLVLMVYKDRTDKAKGHKERSSITLEDICGLEPGPSYEGLSYTLAILCLGQAVVLGFDSKETLLAWDVRIRYSLGEVHRFAVGVQPGTKLETGPASLHLCNNLLVLSRDLPPTIIGQWKLSDLRRYGAVPNGFVFEGGTRCGYWAGVFFLSCAEGEHISFLFDCIVRGISPSRGSFGLRPVLPDPGLSAASMEERVKQEAQELEKRLSLLSHCSHQSSTASTCSYGPSVASDERSISSSSSEASHSDTSLGSRSALWVEPAKTPLPAEPLGLPPSRAPPPSEDSFCGGTIAVGPRAPSRPPHPRGLQEIGRQSSSDSGIATGSHSSYSGSFSSYTGSLDIGHGDEFGSLASLLDQNLCTCSAAEYQLPSTLQHLYDTPRSLHLAAPPSNQSAAVPHVLRGGDTIRQSADFAVSRGPAAASSQEPREVVKAPAGPAPKWTDAHRLTLDLRGSEVTPSGGACTESCESHRPTPAVPRALFAPCSICGRMKGTTLLQSAVLPVPAVPGGGTVLGPSAAGRAHRQVTDPKGGYELMASAVDTPRRGDLSPRELGGTLAFSTDTAAPSDRPRGDGVTYVNIPISPTSKKQPHYMELELQEPGVASLRRHGGGSTKYAQIDIAATETAHRVGSQHAQYREERLQELEQRRKGSQQ